MKTARHTVFIRAGRWCAILQLIVLGCSATAADTLPLVTVFSNDAATAEPNGSGHFTLARFGDTGAALTVKFAAGGTATAGVDYRTLPGQAVIPAGATTVSLEVKVLDDSIFEGPETVTVSLLSDAAYVIADLQTTTVTILDNEIRPALTVAASVPVALEGSAQPGIFTFTRSGNTDAELVIDYVLTGSATNGGDYELVPSQLTIPIGSSTVTLAIHPLDDTPFRPSRAAVVTLRSNALYRVASVATTIILRNSEYYAVESPSSYQVFQRDAADKATIHIQGAYHGRSLPVEAAWGNGAWQVIDSIPSDHFAGDLTLQSVGQAPLHVRVQGHPESESVVAYVGVGDIFAVWGQSNGSGRGVNNQSYSHLTLRGCLYGNDWRWGDLTDPTDRNTGQVDAVSSDVDNGMGSVWPLVATKLMSALNFPVAFVPCAKGDTKIPQWSPDATNPLGRGTLFGSAVSRCLAVGGVKAVLWWQGEDGFDDVTGDSYVIPFKQMSAQMAAHLPGVKVIPCKLQYCVGISDTRQQNGWHGIQRIWDEDPNATSGPALADDPPPDGGNLQTEVEGQPLPWKHLKSDAALEEAAVRWSAVLLDVDRPPSLKAVVASDHLILAWPRRDAYVLEKSTNPDSVWTTVETVPMTVGQELSLMTPISDVKAFFRLRRR